MADLKYDTEAIRDTAKKYSTIAKQMSDLEKMLKTQIEDLKSIYWKSDAGTAFQNMYEDGWADNVDKYVAVLKELADQLTKVAADYDTITAKLKTIEGITIS